MTYLSNEDIFETLGGLKSNQDSKEDPNIFKLNNGEKIVIRHNSSSIQNYWYNINKNILTRGIDYCVFVTGLYGFYKIPIQIISDCINKNMLSHQKKTNQSNYKVVINKDLSVPEIITLKGFENVSISDYFFEFNKEYNFSYELNKEIDVFDEGSVKKVLVNVYERNAVARKKCIEHFGCNCQICGFDFAEKYGKQYSDIIEVHHIKPLNEIGENYIVDPIKDLIPVCSNCHTILHKKLNGKFMTIEDLKNKFNK